MAENDPSYSEPLRLDESISNPLPHNELNEYSLLAVLMESGDNWDMYGGQTSPSDFMVPNYRIVFEEMQKLADSGVELKAFNVASRISARLSPDHPAVQVAAEMHGAVGIGDPSTLLRNVQDYALRRKLISELKASISKLYDMETEDVNAEIDAILDRVDKVTEERLTDEDVIKNSAPELLDPVLEEIAYIREHGQPRKFLQTGFKGLDEMSWGGLREGHLIVLAGRPGMGKTSFALNLCEEAVFRNEKDTTVLFLSLEQRAEEIITKMISAISEIPFGKLKQTRLNAREEQELETAIRTIKEYLGNFIVMNPDGLTIGDLVHTVKQVKRSRGRLDLVVIDYVGLMQPPRNRRQESRALEIAEITRGLKNLANHAEVPILALAQLNRNADSRTDQRPRLSDLRDSGSIEQDADMVLMLHREVTEKNDPDYDKVKLIVTKNRHGPMGSMTFKFIEAITVFEEINVSEDSEPLPDVRNEIDNTENG